MPQILAVSRFPLLASVAVALVVVDMARHRRTIRRAVAVVALSALFVSLVLLVLAALEPGKPFLGLAFEGR
jgi:hypothetical protein